MANNKRTYQIEINGIKQSTSALDELMRRLDDLNKRFADLENRTINVKVNQEVNETTTTEVDVKPQVEAEKALEQAHKSRLKALQDLTNGVTKYKEETKQLVNEEKKAINEANGYANTLNGLKKRLQDLNNIKGNIDLGTEEYQEVAKEINAVNTSLKELEAQQGINSRNVGNYSSSIISAAEGLKSFNVNAKDVKQQIQTLTKSLKELHNEGKSNTEQFKELQSELLRLKSVNDDVDESINQLSGKAPAINNLVQAFQGFNAAMQVGSGVAAVFGRDQEDIAKQMQKVVNLMSIANGLQTIQTQLNTKGTAINKLWTASMAGAEKVMSLFNKTTKATTASTIANATATKGAATATNAMTVATKASTVAMKGLKVAIASTGVGLLVILIGELVSWMMKLSDNSKSASKNINILQNSIIDFEESLAQDQVGLDYYEGIGIISTYERNVEEINNIIDKLSKLSKDVVKIGAVLKKNKIKIDIENVSFNEAIYAIKQYEKAWGDANTYITKEASKAYEETKKIILGHVIDISKNIKEVETKLKFGTKTAEEIDEINKELDKFTTQLIKVKDLKINFNELLNTDGINEMISEIATNSKNLNKKLIQNRIDAQQLSDKADEISLDALEDNFSNRLKIIEANRQKELKIYQSTDLEEKFDGVDLNNLSAKQSIELDLLESLKKTQAAINAKYDRQALEQRKQYGKELIAIENSIINNQIAIQQEGLPKRIAQLEQQRKQEVESAKDSGIKVGEQTIAINDKYDKLIFDEKEKFFKEREKQLESFENNYRSVAERIAALEYEFADTNINLRLDNALDSLTFDVDMKSMQDAIQAQKEFYEQSIELRNNAIDRLAEIDIERAQFVTDDSIKEELNRFKERQDILENSLKEGLITQEEYDFHLQKENEQHEQAMTAITSDGVAKTNEILKNANKSKLENNKSYFDDSISLYSEYINDISALESKALVKFSSTNIIDYNKTKKNLKLIKDEYKNVLNGIQVQYIQLQEAFDRKEISFNDFQLAKKELKSLEDSVNDSSEGVDKSLDELLQNTIASITQYVGQFVNVLGGLWSTWNEMQNRALEQQQKALEEEYDMLQKAYEKQEELTKKHTDKLNSIEDELKTSRGDRRAHLIEQLNAEKKAMIDSLLEEQRIEKEKELNQKKQDEVEKKRREQEKKNAVVQATINTFTAVTNALAVQPWFVGVALSAVALAMGMANVNQIKKQKYAKGGLLNGKSHSQGGIQIPNTGIEVEGKEFITRKKSTIPNIGILEFINESERKLTKDDFINYFDNNNKRRSINKVVKSKYADGGQLSQLGDLNIGEQLQNTIINQDNRPIVVEVVEILNAIESLREVQTISGAIN